MSQLLAALFALMIGIMSIPVYYEYQHNATDNVRAASAASQASQFNTAANLYIEQYSTNIQSVATNNTPAIITVAMLQAVNLLPATFGVDPYGQTFELEVLQPSAGNLTALAMTYGGTKLSDKDITKVATIVATRGFGGGFIPGDDSGLYPGGTVNAYGVYGQWKQATNHFTNVGGGELATLMTYNNGQLVDNRLYRVAVPGQPQLNTMSTDLNMGNNNINNAKSVNSTTDNTGTLNATGNANVTGNVTGNTLLPNLVATAGASCSSYSSGSIAHDSSGGLLSCQSGTWGSTGGGWAAGMWSKQCYYGLYKSPGLGGGFWKGTDYCQPTGSMVQQHFSTRTITLDGYICCPG